MTRFAFRSLTLTVSGAVLLTSLTACGGSSSGPTATPSSTSSASPTATASPDAQPISIYLSLPPERASEAKSRVKDLPGVVATHYAPKRERFSVFMRADISDEQRKAVERALKRMLRN